MKAFQTPLEELKDFEDLSNQLKTLQGIVLISGCIDAGKPHMIYGIGDGFSKVVVASSEQKAKELYEEYRFFDKEAVYFPAKDILFYQSDIHGNLLTQERILALQAISEREQVTLFTTFDGLMNKLAEPFYFTDAVKKFIIGDVVDLARLEKELVAMGYVRN